MDFSKLKKLFRKRQVAVPSDEPTVKVRIDGMLCLDGFCCVRCRAGLFDDRMVCLVCKMPYSERVAEVVRERREAKRRLVKILEYDAVADVLKETTEKIARDSKLSPKKTFAEMLAFWGA